MSDNPFLLPGAGRAPAPVSAEPGSADAGSTDAAAVAEETRFAPRPSPEHGRWRLILPTDRIRELSGTLVLGRDPAATEEPGAELLVLDDPGRTVSKTHAVLTVRDGALLVRDLHSTNGTVVTSGTRRLRVQPDHEAPVPAGASVELGSFVIRVELAPSRE